MEDPKKAEYKQEFALREQGKNLPLRVPSREWKDMLLSAPSISIEGYEVKIPCLIFGVSG